MLVFITLLDKYNYITVLLETLKIIYNNNNM